MSIPLVRNNTKDAINTSIIAIKKNLERINSLLGLMDNSDPDLSGLATKQELEDAVTEINDTIDEVETSLQPVDAVASGDMHSVTSNAVAKSESYLTDEIIDTGKIFKTYSSDEYKVYRITARFNLTDYADSSNRRTFGFTYPMPANTLTIINANGYYILNAPSNANGYGRKYTLGSCVANTGLNIYIASNCDFIENTGNAYLSFILDKSNFPITNITGYAFLEFIKSS